MRTATPILFALCAVFVLAASPGSTEERPCRPSLSNLWHCPGDQNGTPKATPKTTERACRPSLSNGYHCPGTVSAPEAAPPSKHTAHTKERACRPSLSNGYHCPGQAASNEPETTSQEKRACRPSLSNGFNCGPAPKASTETQLGKDQYATEVQAAEHCRRDVVVWLNTATGVYHYAGTHWYGNTKSGAYMCEKDSVDDGMRHAKNEEPPHT